MPVVIMSRWKGNMDQARPLARQVAVTLKEHGAVSVRLGPCYAGPHTGQVYVWVTFPDWATFGGAHQAFSADPNYARLFGEVSTIAEVQERSLIVAEDL
jgi:hypothetical protein